jgi:hypothetical protein
LQRRTTGVHAAGAKGVFTINQGMTDDQVLALVGESS